MELKLCSRNNRINSLNRTFYGIETNQQKEVLKHAHVLIVPFMELKRRTCLGYANR